MSEEKADEVKEVKVEETKSDREKRIEIYHIIFIFLMIVAIGALINTTITIYKHKDMLINPLGYNLEQYNIDYCMCYANNDKTIIPVPSLSYNGSVQDLLPEPTFIDNTPKLNTSLLNWTK